MNARRPERGVRQAACVEKPRPLPNRDGMAGDAVRVEGDGVRGAFAGEGVGLVIGVDAHGERGGGEVDPVGHVAAERVS